MKTVMLVLSAALLVAPILFAAGNRAVSDGMAVASYGLALVVAVFSCFA